jgi:hypothetical protein
MRRGRSEHGFLCRWTEMPTENDDDDVSEALSEGSRYWWLMLIGGACGDARFCDWIGTWTRRARVMVGGCGEEVLAHGHGMTRQDERKSGGGRVCCVTRGSAETGGWRCLPQCMSRR